MSRLSNEQIDYINNVIQEHLLLNREYMRELWRDDYEVDFVVDELKMLKDISLILKRYKNQN